MAWRDLTSVVRRPRRWQLASSTALSKTVKMSIRFRHPTTMVLSSPTSSQKDLALLQPSLLKGWVYEAKGVSMEVKAKVIDPSQYLMLDTPLTCSKCKSVDQLDDPHHRHQQALSITEAPPISPSISKRTAVKCQLVTSRLTSTCPTHL
jgi:hypothetical protein